MRVILYTGKGGVGKTTISAATACKLAKEGQKVLIMSTDQAHSLSDSLEVKLTSEPQEAARNLWALEIDTVKESEDAWGHLQSYLKRMITSRSGESIEVEEMLVFPGFEELFSLFKILTIYQKNEYDVLIVDCAPTGETLALLKFPEMFGNFINQFLPSKRRLLNAAGPVLEKVTKVPMPDDTVFGDVERLIDKLYGLQSLMLNKDVLSVRIVTTPEKIVIKEAKRNFTCMHLYDYNVDAIIVNKIYPAQALKGYFNRWVTLQQEGLEEINNSFRDIPVFNLQLQDSELKGIPMLEQISSFYNTANPEQVLATSKIFTTYEKNGCHIMEVNLPFAEKSDLNLNQKSGEIHIAVKNEKRCIMLPENLKNKEITKAKFDNGILTIHFANHGA